MRRRPAAKMIAALPIRQKISGIVMLTTLCALLLACGAFILYDFHSVRRSTARDLDTLAGVVASNSAAALMFKDVQACADILSGLRARPSITAGAIYTSDGKALVTYGTLRVPGLARNGSAVIIDDDGIHVFRRIEFRGDVIGTLYLASDLREMQSRMHVQVGVPGGILALALLIALAMTARLQILVTGPLLELADTARRVTREKDYSVRVAERDRLDHDEIGAVMHAFNEMLEQIEKRDEALRRNRADLERQVLLRTGELTAANEELLVAKNAAEKVAEINAQLARESALILNSATDGILGIGLDNRPTFLNPAGARILGMTLRRVYVS